MAKIEQFKIIGNTFDDLLGDGLYEAFDEVIESDGKIEECKALNEENTNELIIDNQILHEKQGFILGFTYAMRLNKELKQTEAVIT